MNNPGRPRQRFLTIRIDHEDEDALQALIESLRAFPTINISDITSRTTSDIVTQAKREATLLELLSLKDGQTMNELHQRLLKTPSGCSYKTLQRTVASLRIRNYLTRTISNSGHGRTSIIRIARR